MPNRTSQDEDSAEDDVPIVNASIHSDEPSEQETEDEEDEEDAEDEEDEETSTLSRPHQLVRSRRSPLIILPTTTFADFIPYTPSLTYLNLRL